MRNRSLILICFLLMGCRTTSSFILSDSDLPFVPDSALLLESAADHEAMVLQFVARHSRVTENDKIQYLLSMLRESQALFARNGDRYDGKTCAMWLSWKMRHRQYRDDPILTAWDFVNRVADRSLKSGKPYQVIFPANRRELLRTVLAHELLRLERALRDNAMETALINDAMNSEKTAQAKIPVPILVPTHSAVR